MLSCGSGDSIISNLPRCIIRTCNSPLNSIVPTNWMDDIRR